MFKRNGTIWFRPLLSVALYSSPSSMCYCRACPILWNNTQSHKGGISPLGWRGNHKTDTVSDLGETCDRSSARGESVCLVKGNYSNWRYCKCHRKGGESQAVHPTKGASEYPLPRPRLFLCFRPGLHLDCKSVPLRSRDTHTRGIPVPKYLQHATTGAIQCSM